MKNPHPLSPYLLRPALLDPDELTPCLARSIVPKDGNGFFVNIPNQSFDVVLTAGHNLVEAPQKYTSDVRIVLSAGAEIHVSSDMMRVCQRYLEAPSELNAIYDYGAILLPRDRKKALRGFGFGLLLGLAPPLLNSNAEPEKDVLQDRPLYVSGYRPKDLPSTGPPRRAEGLCVQAGRNQLVYTADAEEGISGGPVWLGFRGMETVVAIQ